MKFSPASIVLTLFNLAFFSFVVGIALYFARIDPMDLWQNFGETIRQAWEVSLEFFQWGSKYMALGAIIVVPIWLAWRLARMLMSSRPRPPEPQ
jgi:hypothetical protein